MSAGSLPDGLHDVPAGRLADVVTSLEMRHRPVLATAAARHDDIRFRHEEVPELGWYRILFRAVGASWLWTSRLLLDDVALGAILRDPAVDVFAVERDGCDIGLLELDFRQDGECEIAFFGLIPTATGQGIGRWMMDQALRHAWARPIARVWVHTCTLDHPAALPFYIASGFVPFRRQVGIGDDPRRRGLLPMDAAPQIPLL